MIEAYRMARRHFPRAKLSINDYDVIDKPENTRHYRAVIDLPRSRHLLNGIGVQAHAFETDVVHGTHGFGTQHSIAATANEETLVPACNFVIVYLHAIRFTT
ncbi:endo-1,4-beta-xylanase [Rhodanobacter sp. 115]|uniref:endo-1,4-beta-xylanase n=1 Tax=Rhodanobacter sp. FW021-MT20 TaxID=1162282 RepID=UPI0002FF75F1|nr:endo-1,4-beta-xylanase [Rhodanobacter sp. 115]